MKKLFKDTLGGFSTYLKCVFFLIITKKKKNQNNNTTKSRKKKKKPYFKCCHENWSVSSKERMLTERLMISWPTICYQNVSLDCNKQNLLMLKNISIGLLSESRKAVLSHYLNNNIVFQHRTFAQGKFRFLSLQETHKNEVQETEWEN